jgi:hypothetical protein
MEKNGGHRRHADQRENDPGAESIESKSIPVTPRFSPPGKTTSIFTAAR